MYTCMASFSPHDLLVPWTNTRRNGGSLNPATVYKIGFMPSQLGSFCTPETTSNILDLYLHSLSDSRSSGWRRRYDSTEFPAASKLSRHGQSLRWVLIAVTVFFPWQQKMVLKVSSMSDERVKQKAMETVADIYGEVLATCFFSLFFYLLRLSFAILVK